MQAQLCFFKDLDSFQVEPNHLELVYQTKFFRFVYPDDLDVRKFSVKTLENIQVTLPEMLFQYETDGMWSGLHIVDLCAGFIDMMKFADFLAKLGNIAGYQQLIVPTSNASAEIQSNSEDEEESFEDFEGDELDESNSVDQMNPRPRLSLFEDYTRMNVTRDYMELTIGRESYRFAHPPANRAWEFAAHQRSRGQLPPGKNHVLRIYGVILQGQPLQRVSHQGAYDVDLYIAFEDSGLWCQLMNALCARGYVVVP